MKSSKLRIVVLAVVGGAVLGGLYGWLKPTGNISGSAAAHGAIGGALAPAVAAQSPNSQAMPPHVARPSQVAGAQSSPLARNFVQSSNLAQFVAENAAKAKDGDGERSMYIAAAYQECMPLGVDPAGFEAQRRQLYDHLPKELQTNRQRFDAATQREMARCSELNQQHDRQQKIDQWIAAGAKAGNLSAQIAAIETSSQLPSPDRIRDVLSDVVASKDPQAISQLGNLMSLVAGEDKSQFQTYGGSTDANYAWQLAACNFGMDCSWTGQGVQQICLTAGLCSYDSLEEAYSKLLAPVEFQQVVKQRDELVAIIQKGDVNSLYH